MQKPRIKVIKVKSEPILMPLVMGFTGHRDLLADEAHLELLADISLAVPRGVVWVQGCARGFDTQVKNLGERRGITVQDEPPNKEVYGVPAAFFVRNRLIVDQSDLVVALWDGRQEGGTFSTLQYARKQHKMILILPPHRKVED